MVGRGADQSLGLEPQTETLITTSSGPGVGMGESVSFTTVPGWTNASFMVALANMLLSLSWKMKGMPFQRETVGLHIFASE